MRVSAARTQLHRALPLATRSSRPTRLAVLYAAHLHLNQDLEAIAGSPTDCSHDEEEDKVNLRATAILAALVINVAPAYAQPADSISITVANNDSQDSMMTVADQNQAGTVVFGPGGRINQGASTNSLPITADGNGKGSIAWAVVTTSSPPARICSSASGLTVGSQVNVSSGLAGGSPC